MYAKRNDKVLIVENNSDLIEKADEFFAQKNANTLYVYENGILYGIVCQNDYYRNRNKGDIVNKSFKYLTYMQEQTEEESAQLAVQMFVKYKSIKEIPVVDKEMHLCYSYIRMGTAYDVMPARFAELYGNSERLARFIDKNVEDHICIYTDNPSLLETYLDKYEVKRKVTYERSGSGESGRCMEKILEDFEYELFQKRVEKDSMRVAFFELPEIHELTNLLGEEIDRIHLAKERTTQYYLQNYLENQEMKKLVDEVLGKNKKLEDLISALKSVARFVLQDGICYNADFSSESVNVVDGRRVTTDVPGGVCGGGIYVFGPCTVFGVLVEDKDTIPSCMQRLLNQNNIGKEVINEGVDAVSLLEEIRKFNRAIYRENSVFIFFVQNEKEREQIEKRFSERTIYKLASCYNQFEFHNYFFDLPSHPNSEANNQIAEFVYHHCEKMFKESVTGGLGFLYPLEQENEMVETEELEAYLDYLKDYYQHGKNGAIVMNCNPFTNGHLYLIQYAAKLVDHLYVFVVSEDKSYFPFADRIQLVRDGISGKVENVTVLESGKFILSENTFPEYFTKENADEGVMIDTSLDLKIFCKVIVPALEIACRFAGEEPYDVVTRQYNRDMNRILPMYGVEFICIKRKEIQKGKAISASDVRKLWKAGNKEEVRKRVPESTFQYLFGMED